MQSEPVNRQVLWVAFCDACGKSYFFGRCQKPGPTCIFLLAADAVHRIGSNLRALDRNPKAEGESSQSLVVSGA